MKLLALDSSGLVASAAVLEDEVLLAEYTVNYKKTHSQTLLPMLDEIARMIELDLSEVDAVAVAAGPGSFTGLRIGSATAKGIALALGIPIVEVPTLDAMAYTLWRAEGLICPIMDARRQQVYTGIYENRDGLNILRPQCVVAFTEIAGELNRLGREVIFLGDGAPVNEGAMREQMQVPYLIAPAHLNRQRAASTAVRAAQIYAEKGEAALVSADDFRPEYLRIPQAERERGDKRNYKVFVE